MQVPCAFRGVLLSVHFSEAVWMRVVRIKDYVELTGVTIKSTLVSSVCLGSFSIKCVSAKLIVIKLQLFTQEYSRKLCTSPTVDFKPGNYCRKQMFGVEM